jgi:predicted dehydrogenase
MIKTAQVRWGVLGCARIFDRRVSSAFALTTNSEVIAIASRSKEKADDFASRHKISKAYGSYEALLRDPDIEAVYIALPNHLHTEWTLRAIEAGKHVLCEKPVALSYADARRAADEASARKLRLMEALMFRHHPQHARIREIAASGEIGEVVNFRGAFTFPASDVQRLWDASMGGGALLDVGVYPISAARYHFNAEPQKVAALAAFERGVDRHIIGILEFSGGRTACVEGGFDQTYTIRYEIVGTQGAVITDKAFQPGPTDVLIQIRTENGFRTESISGIDHYAAEITHFSEGVRNLTKDLYPGEDGQAQIRVIEALATALREQRVVDVLPHPASEITT